MSTRRGSSTQVASSVPFYNGNALLPNDPKSVQAAIDEVVDLVSDSASPGFTWGRSGNVSSGAWLQNDSVPSNLAGRKVDFNNPALKKILVTNENNNTFTVGVYEHDGTVYTQLATISLSSERSKSSSVNVPITNGRELAIKIESGSCKNVVVAVVLSGSN